MGRSGLLFWSRRQDIEYGIFLMYDPGAIRYRGHILVHLRYPERNIRLRVFLQADWFRWGIHGVVMAI
jgi:hypothetical protein